MSSMFRITDFTALVNELEVPLNIPASRLLTETNLLDYRTVLKNPDTQLVRSALGVVENVLDTIGRGLRDIDAVRDFVVENQRKMESLQASYRALVAPIRRLPTELLQEIFKYARELDEENFSSPPATSQVCRYWRQIALSTPRLWAKILHFVDVKGSAEHLGLWTQRSAGCPLSLVVQPKRRSHSSVGTAAEFTRAVVNNAHRLEQLALKVPHSQLRGVLDAWRAPDLGLTLLPLLRLFKAVADPSQLWNHYQAEMRSHSYQQMCRIICTKAPHLERVDCAGIAFPDHTAPISWKTIKYFSGDLPLPTLASCLSGSEQIEILETGYYVEKRRVRRLIPLAIETIATCAPLLHLTSLQLNRDNIPSKPELFPELPALRHLIYDGRSLHSDPSAFFLFLARWGPQLLYLGLPSSDSASFDLACLDLSPKLEALGTSDNAFFHKDGILSERSRHFSHLEINLSKINKNITNTICDRLNPTRLNTLTIIGNASIDTVTEKIDYLRLCATALGITNVYYMEKGCRRGRFNTPYFTQKGGTFDDGVRFDELEGPTNSNSHSNSDSDPSS